MQFLRDYPVTYFLFALLSGILFENGFLLLPVILLIISAALLFRFYRNKRNFSVLLIIFLISIIEPFMIGSLRGNKPSYPFEEIFIKESIVKGKVDDIFKAKENRLDIILRNPRVLYDSCNLVAKGKILFRCYFKNLRKIDSLDNLIEINDSLEFFSKIKIPPNERNYGDFDYRKYLLQKDIVALGNLIAKKKIEVIKSKKNSIYRFANNLKRSVARRIDEIFNRKSAAFIKGILLAERSFITKETKEDFINTGVVHVLAVSGLHVGIIFLILNSLFGRFDVRLRYSFVLITLVLFAFITEFPSSVLRAETMAIIYIIVKLTSRDKNSFNILFLTAFFILLADNSQLFNTGFQFSFLSVLFILLGLKISNKIFYLFKIRNSMLRAVLSFIFVSFFAQLGTLPLSIIYFNKVSLVAIITNLLVIPLIGLLLPLAIVAVAFSYISGILALPYVNSFEFIYNFITKFIEIFSKADFSHLAIYRFAIYKAVLYYFLIFTIFYFIVKSVRKREILLSSIAFLISLTMIFNLPEKELLKDGRLNLVVLDVGQGDSFFLKFPNGKTALIDAGNNFGGFDAGKDVIYPFLMRNGISKIDFAFLSHVDGDHYLGYYYLVKKGVIDTLYKPELKKEFEKDVKFEKYLKERDVKVFYYKDTSLTLGNSIIYFLQRNSGKEILRSMNDNSGVLKIVYGKNSFLFTGDVGVKREKVLIENYNLDFLRTDLLKLGHHGSKHSTSVLFLKTVNPKITVISCGLGNRFNHPAKDVLLKLVKFDTEIYRTDYSGMLFFESDGDSLKAINWRIN